MSITDPVLAAIRAAPKIPVVYDARVPETPDANYVVVYPDLGLLSSPALCGDLVTSDITFRLVYVSTTRTSVEDLCTAVRGAILNRSFTDGVWTAEFDPDDFHNTTPVSWDETVPDRVVMFATDEFKALAHR